MGGTMRKTCNLKVVLTLLFTASLIHHISYFTQWSSSLSLVQFRVTGRKTSSISEFAPFYFCPTSLTVISLSAQAAAPTNL
ncbi:hypothetical protein LguiB_004119 [Lonicera macranthoides]